MSAGPMRTPNMSATGVRPVVYTRPADAVDAGFQPVGTLADDGIRMKPTSAEAFAAHEKPIVTRLRRSVRFSIKVDVQHFDAVLCGAITGNPLAVAAYGFRRINPHWYLERADDE